VLTDIHQKKPTENERLSSLFSARDCSCLRIEVAQNWHTAEEAPLNLQEPFADNNIHSYGETAWRT
jgi:hypothetical protein